MTKEVNQAVTATHFIGADGTLAGSNLGRFTIADAKTLLGLTGTNSGDQTTIVGITGTKAQFDTACTDGNFVYTDAIGVSVQGYDATLAAVAALTIAANSLTVGTGADAFSQTTFAANTFPARSSTGDLVAKAITDFGLSLVDDATASDARTTLGLGTLATQSGTFSGTSSGTNTGDQTITLTGDVTGSGTGSFATTIAAGAVDLAMLSATGTPSASTFLRGDNTWATPAGSGDVSKVGTPVNNQVGIWTGDGTIEGASSFTYDGANLQVTGDIGSTGTRITKGWFADLQVTNAIAGSVTGNAATVTTNANLTGHVTSTGNAAVLGSFTKAQLNTAVSDGDVVYSGDALGTPSSGTLTNCSGLPLSGVVDSTTEALGVGSIELGHASDTTIARVRAGVASVEGEVIGRQSKSITIPDPTNAEDLSLFYADEAWTITKIVAVLVGSSTPSLTWTVRKGSDRSATGTEVVTGGTTTTSTTTGSVVTSLTSATIAADDFVWLETTAKSGTVNQLHVTIFMEPT